MAHLVNCAVKLLNAVIGMGTCLVGQRWTDRPLYRAPAMSSPE
jgi:hypothetical protein